MFDLETAITEWRRQMQADGVKQPEVLDELESHLRDDVAQQTRAGWDARVAFESAALRIGQAALLRKEFAKVGTIRHAIARVRRGKLAFAGIPDRYLDVSMNTSPTLEPGWATYLRSLAFLVPAVAIWMLATTFIMPQMNAITQAPKVHETWSKVAASPAIVFVRVGRLNTALGGEFRDHLLLILGAAALALGLLEWRSVRWPRYRRAIIGSGVFLLNVLFVLSLGIMFLMTALEAQALFVDFK
jgi:hypothetical protein